MNRPSVEEIIGLIGEKAVLIPLKRSSKGAAVAGWNRFTVAKMSDPKYLARLANAENIAVLLGKPSGGLVSLDMDSDEELTELLQLNPTLAGALRTTRKRRKRLAKFDRYQVPWNDEAPSPRWNHLWGI